MEESKNEKIIDWNLDVKVEPASRGARWAGMFIAMCILFVIGTGTLLTVHWLFTRFW